MPLSMRLSTVRARPDQGPDTLASVLAEVRGRELEPGALITDVLAGGFRSTFRGGGVEFADVREYVEGDDPRAVDWNVTARMGRPFVKQFVEERERTLVFVLDLSAGMGLGIGAWSARQMVARAVASLSLMAIGNHDRVGLVAGDAQNGIVRFVLPKKGPGHVLRVVRDCVELGLGHGGGAVDAMLARLGSRLRRRAVVFVCSDFAGERPLPALAQCARRHDVVALRALPRELLAPPRAVVRCSDPATGRVAMVDFTAASVRGAWQRRIAQWRQGRDQEFWRAGVDCIDLEVPAAPELDAVLQPLLRFVRRRRLGGGAR